MAEASASTPSITLKIAVFAPMPMARVIKVIAANKGDRLNLRAICRSWVVGFMRFRDEYVRTRAEAGFF